MTDNQERKIFYHSSYVQKAFISALSLLNGVTVIAKIVFLNKQTSFCWFKHELRGFYNFTWRNIAIGEYLIYKKQMKKILLSKNEAFLFCKNST